ncbi:MAG TPA: enoyl-CoA hydratase-related protein [Planctomycetota bacterium]|nr:enoyl-CoA hydratase-related protein [Planctomycetota bacterium]
MEFVKISVEDGIGTISISHPPVNALSGRVFAEIREAALKFQADPAVRVIVLTGEGANFAAGADIKEIQSIQGAAEGEAMCRKGQEVTEALWNSPVPVIAAINGYCLGGGNELAMACHMRVATDKARFAQPEVRIGIVPGLGGSQRLPRYIGVAKAFELLLTGEMLSAQEAKALGLVNLVVPEAELRRQTVGLAKKIAAQSKTAVRAILDAVRRGAEMELSEGLKLEARIFGGMMETEDKKEGVLAFIEKRPPKFS